MRWVSRLALATTGLVGIGIVRDFLSKYQILLFDKNELNDLEDQAGDAMDLRGNPTHECICGSRVFYIKAAFDDYEIGSYYLDMQCVECGSLATAPTLLDRESQE